MVSIRNFKWPQILYAVCMSRKYHMRCFVRYGKHSPNISDSHMMQLNSDVYSIQISVWEPKLFFCDSDGPLTSMNSSFSFDNLDVSSNQFNFKFKIQTILKYLWIIGYGMWHTVYGIPKESQNPKRVSYVVNPLGPTSSS